MNQNDADFYEDKFPFKLRTNGGVSSINISLNKNKENNESILEIQKSKRARVEKDSGPDFYAYTLEEDPNTIQEALLSLDADL